MYLTHRLALTGLPFAAIVAGPAVAQSLELSIAIPKLSVAEYHRPYVAVWLESAGAPAKTLSVWYDAAKPKGEGQKWLHEVRQWWRASGRDMSFPADGVSGATRAPGVQKLAIAAGRGPLAPGQYTLVVEAAREVGGREILRLPFAWPPKPGQTATAAGTAELGDVSLSFKR